jgi:homoserine/homoserine lactone efflux protein
MIDPAVLLAFVATSTVLLLIPGPNIALIVANSVAYGPKYGLLTVAGTSSAMVIQLSIAALGMAEALGALGKWFEWLRWAGAAYLIYLGVMHWRAPAADLSKTAPQPQTARALYGRALLVSLTNPKLLLFYGAFFPQFIRASQPVGAQIAVLATTFVVLASVLDGSWALLAGHARGLVATRTRLRNRVTGGLLVTAGAALSLVRHH